MPNFSRFFELPRDCRKNLYDIYFCAPGKLFVDGNFAIIDISEEVIILKANNGFIKISGKNLTVSNFCNSELEIEGIILDICFE